MLEYFEAGGGRRRQASLRADRQQPHRRPTEPFSAEYFANSTLSGTPVLAAHDDRDRLRLGRAARRMPRVPADLFSARWTRTKTYAAGTYRFSVTGDDGIRVLVDGALVVDGWFYQAPTTYTADVAVAAGQHTVVVEYFEWTGGAVARFSEARLPDPPP